MLLVLLALGCPAEQLGIPVPKGGVEAIAMDDLVRDTAQLTKAASPEDRLAFLAERWDQMGLDAREGGRCGVREGTTADAVAVLAQEGTPGDAASWTAAAAAISVAKAFHGRPAGPRAVWFCVGEAPFPVVEVWRIEAGTGDPDYRAAEQRAKEIAVAVEAKAGP